MEVLERFNPRAREGRDANFRMLNPRSICFNPRAREGRDTLVKNIWRSWLRFNPRAREGRDAEPASKRILFHGFNPRAREGRDRAADVLQVVNKDVSIRAPVRGATCHTSRVDPASWFQSARP